MASLALEAMTPRDRTRRGCAGKTDPGAARESRVSEVAQEGAAGGPQAPRSREEIFPKLQTGRGGRCSRRDDSPSNRVMTCNSVFVALSTRGTRTMAPAKVTDAFQATKRGRGVAKGKPKAKSARAAGTYPCVRLVRRRDASKENSHPIPTVTIR